MSRLIVRTQEMFDALGKEIEEHMVALANIDYWSSDIYHKLSEVRDAMKSELHLRSQDYFPESEQRK
jgi:hypothetical protein